MKSVKSLRRKAASRKAKTAPVYSTSEARANFAETLETVQAESAVIGFDRYGRTVAALVPIEAVYILAGMGASVAPDLRSRIQSAASDFVDQVPNRVGKRIERKREAKATPKKKRASASSAKAKARRR
jgi:antitoxin (DNA-binding transcriptional repressor) of toxin-antitoxin stability system